MVEPTYSIDKQCVVCESPFKVVRVRGRQAVLKHDSDFCTWFKDINPYFYSIWVCSKCGYAATEDNFEKVPLPAREKLKIALKDNPLKADLSGERGMDQAIGSYQQAIYCCEIIGAPASRLAELYLKLAWIYRQNNLEDDEKEYLEKAAEKYDEALSKERLPIGNLSELATTYLIGELSRRVGNNEKASLYFSKIIGNQMSKLEPKILNMTKDIWQTMRSEKSPS